MGIIRVQLINWSGGGHKYKKVYRVETDDPNIGPRTIENYFRDELGIRKGVSYSHGTGDTSESDVSSFAGYPVIEPFQANRYNWTVTWNYTDEEEEEQDDQNPLNEPPTFSRFAQAREEVIERDIHGKPIRNSAYDRYDEVLTRDAHRTVLRVSKNFAAWPQSNYRFMNVVNRSRMRIDDEFYDPRQVRVLNMQDDRAYSEVLVTEDNPKGLYFAVQLELAFAEDDWQLVLLDQGVRQKYRRWLVTYFADASTTAEVRTAILPEAAQGGQPGMAETPEEARLLADRNFVLWTTLQEISPGYQPVRETPAPLTDATGVLRQSEGAVSKLPMLLNGKGRQSPFNSVPVWNEYQGYFEADFAIFGLG